VTGNTGIDAVLYVRDLLESGALPAPPWPGPNPARRLIVVTSHRRENVGPGFASAMRALARIAERPDVEIVYPVHRNPNVVGPAHELLSNRPNIHLIDPVAYVPFVRWANQSWFCARKPNGRRPLKPVPSNWSAPTKIVSCGRPRGCLTTWRNTNA